MKNLFIMHTQYNLILAAAVLSRNENADNTLVLFSEFAVNEAMLSALKNIFDRIIVVRDNYYAPKSVIEEIREIRSCLKKVKALKDEHFDNVYMSQERIFDRILCARAKKINPQVWCCNIEEDAYYSINEQFNAKDFVYNEGWRAKCLVLLYAILLLGHPYNFREVCYCYGMSKEYHGAYLLFPWLARKELQGKELLEIRRSELIYGIQAIYSDEKIPLPQGEKYTVFFFDLMNRYQDPEMVKQLVFEVVKASHETGRTVIFKYHPREKEKFTGITDCFEVPHIVPAEKLFFDLADSDTVVIGNATTACIVAAKLGFRVVSISRLERPNNTKIYTTMEKMGIHCIEDIESIKKIL